jgi:hypothetical protein
VYRLFAEDLIPWQVHVENLFSLVNKLTVDHKNYPHIGNWQVPIVISSVPLTISLLASSLVAAIQIPG